MILTIEVTADDIKNGWDWSAQRMIKKYGRKIFPEFEHKRVEHCPVAIALSRTFGKITRAETYRICVGDDEYRMPEIVSDWMSNFDDEKEVKPFSFEVDTENERLMPGSNPRSCPKYPC